MPDTDTTSVVRLRNINTPELLEVGAVNANEISANDFGAIVKLDKVGVARFTVKLAVMDADEYPGVAVWVAVITVCPALRMVTVLPDMIATAVLLLVNVNVAAVLVFVDVGCNRSNCALPYTRGVTLKFVSIGVIVVIYT